MDGFRVMRMSEAARIGDLFITTTGNLRVIRTEHMRQMRDGAILCNSGHFNVEIDIEGLEKLAVRRRNILEDIDEFQLKNGRRLYLLAEGRLVNLAGLKSLGHPIEIMDMSFSLQALSAGYLAKHGRELENSVNDVPSDIDRRVAELKLRSVGAGLERLTSEQKRYLTSWQLGT